MEFLIKLIDEITAVGFILIFSAYIIGIKFPDWDFKMKLKHRSILTHSPLVLVIMMYFLKEGDSFRYFFVGFSLAMGIHFIFDLFPKGWSGGALLQVPILGLKLPPRISQILFVIFIGICLLFSVNQTVSIFEYIFIFILGIFSLIKNMKKEEKLVRPVTTFLLFFIILGSIKHEEVKVTVVEGSKVVKEATVKYYKQLKNSFS